jgi:phenylalanyl-tRNA synthetase beta chain
MRISLNWLKDFVDFDCPVVELKGIMTMLGIEVEEIIDYSEIFKGFVTAKVLNAEKLENSDKLTVCKVFDGKTERTVICGAPNVATGQTVCLGTPGAVVPKNGIKLDERKIRGVMSSGMICSRAELELDDDHSGIWVLPPDTPIGLPLADFLGMNDVVFEIGITPNRPDWLSHIGVARELAAHFGTKIHEYKIKLFENGEPIESIASVEIADSERCFRYAARTVRGVKIVESPDWLKSRITLLGMRPINAAVDVTNLVMLECGQPLHAFNLKNVAGSKIIVRTASEGEKFTTLDSKERTLDASMLMICDAEKPVAIGGVMGGENSEIGDDTTDILIESAYFKPQSVRRTAKRLGIQSESSYRFERGVDINRIIYALDRAAALIAELCGGTIDKGYIDLYPTKIDIPAIKMNYDRARTLIGADIDNQTMKNLLLNLGFEIISEDVESLIAKAPSYRVDISIEADLVEEIARLYNYDNIEPDFISRFDMNSNPVPEHLAVNPLRRAIRDYFANNGWHETITQNMLDPQNAAFFTENPVRLLNPLGEELSIMRPSLVPSMMKTIAWNLRNGTQRIRLFEIGKVFSNVEGAGRFVPGILEKEWLAAAAFGSRMPRQWGVADEKVDFYDIKGAFEGLASFLKILNVTFKINESDSSSFGKNSLEIFCGDTLIGRLGEANPALVKKFDIPGEVFLILVDMEVLAKVERRALKYSKVAAFPAIERDLGFVVDSSAPAEEMRNLILENGGELLKNVTVFDVYTGKSIEPGKKNIAYSLFFQSEQRTLTDEEVEKSTKRIIAKLEDQFGAKLRAF